MLNKSVLCVSKKENIEEYSYINIKGQSQQKSTKHKNFKNSFEKVAWQIILISKVLGEPVCKSNRNHNQIILNVFPAK